MILIGIIATKDGPARPIMMLLHSVLEQRRDMISAPTKQSALLDLILSQSVVVEECP